jgi:hypothetical protein
MSRLRLSWARVAGENRARWIGSWVDTVVGGRAEVGAEQENRAVIVGVPHGAAHSLLDALDLAG